jgi:hypothetical protein
MAVDPTVLTRSHPDPSLIVSDIGKRPEYVPAAIVVPPHGATTHDRVGSPVGHAVRFTPDALSAIGRDAAPATTDDELMAIRTWPPTSPCPRCGQPNGRWQFDDRTTGGDRFRCLACCQVWAGA